MTVEVISVYMDNVSETVAEYQHQCVMRFLPEDWICTQYLRPLSLSNGGSPHAAALHERVEMSTSDIIILLDIDCIPLLDRSLHCLADRAAEGDLVGAIQRANHKDNGGHLYVGPFCMAFLRSRYKQLGSPTFEETDKGDIGEELTYTWQESGSPVHFLWPSHIEKPLWKLTSHQDFGIGTTYANMFYHTFCIRDSKIQDHFISRCKEVLQ